MHFMFSRWLKQYCSVVLSLMDFTKAGADTKQKLARLVVNIFVLWAWLTEGALALYNLDLLNIKISIYCPPPPPPQPL